MKKIVSLFVCCAIISSLCVPAFASNMLPDETIPLTEECLIESGLTPVSVDDVAAMSFEDECDHGVPNGYVSMGVYEGNSVLEAERADEGLEIFSFISDLTNASVLSFLTELANVAGFFEDLNDDGVVRAKYYLYMYHRGPSYWYHYVWVYDSDNDGVEEYLACDVKTFYAK